MIGSVFILYNKNGKDIEKGTDGLIATSKDNPY